MKKQKVKVKKPIFKKWWFWVIIVILAIGIWGGNGDSTADTSDNSATISVESSGSSEENSNVSDSSEKSEPVADAEKKMPQILEEIDFLGPQEVRNDTTGNWRISRCVSSRPIEDYALDYYQYYFESDSEIHGIVNFGLNTTAKISVLMEDTICVDVYEYVDKEEHDAKLLFGGMHLQEFWVDKTTGEIEQIPLS